MKYAYIIFRREMGSISGGQFFSSTAGLAYVGAACTSFRYSINEDHFDSVVIGVAAHEIGHKLVLKIES